MAKSSKKRDEATRWLKGYLAGGARSEETIRAAAVGMGISRATLLRGKASLGVESLRRGSVWYWRDPNVLEDVQGTPSLVEAIRELTRAVRQMAKADRSATVASATEPDFEPEPSFQAYQTYLCKQARVMRRAGLPLETIKTDLLGIAHSCPCDPALSDDLVLRIAERYGQKQIQQPKPLPEILTTDDPYGLLERTDYDGIYKLREAVRAYQMEIQDDSSKRDKHEKWSAWAKKSLEVQRQKRPPRP